MIMGSMQRILLLLRIAATLRMLSSSPLVRRAMALNRQAPLPPKRALRLPRARRRKQDEGVPMKFVVGLLVGIVVGAAGAVLYSVKSGRDLREALDDVRGELEKRDVEALGARLETRFAAMQAQLEERIGQVRERATGIADQASGVEVGSAEAAEVAAVVEAAAEVAAEAPAPAPEAPAPAPEG
jgi:gas vesicle protein